MSLFSESGMVLLKSQSLQRHVHCTYIIFLNLNLDFDLYLSLVLFITWRCWMNPGLDTRYKNLLQHILIRSTQPYHM